MTLFLGADDVAALATPELTVAAVRRAVACERDGTATLPSRLDVDLPSGFMRLMPAALGDVMGAKLMTVVREIGNRYLLFLCDRGTGELTALLDASELTRLRTAAVTLVAGEALCPEGATRIGMIGTGFEAESHLVAFAETWDLQEAVVYSPSRERRNLFATRMSDELGFNVKAVDSADAAVGDAPVSILATKSRQPVVDGDAFAPGAVVLSIGSTRPDLRELDAACFDRTALLLVDRVDQVRSESGDVIEALQTGSIETGRLFEMGEYGGNGTREKQRDLMVFKSVGTALHDLALAEAVLAAAVREGRGRPLGELTELKPSAPPSGVRVSAAAEGA